MNTEVPTLYVCINRDLQSMTNGKAEAHSSHAANLFVSEIGTNNDFYKEWAGTRGFGTQINVQPIGMPFSEAWYEMWNISEHLTASHVVDPTYPFIVDREVGMILRSLSNQVAYECPSFSLLCNHVKDLDDGYMLFTREESTAFYFFIHPKMSFAERAFEHMRNNFKLAP